MTTGDVKAVVKFNFQLSARQYFFCFIIYLIQVHKLQYGQVGHAHGYVKNILSGHRGLATPQLSWVYSR